MTKTRKSTEQIIPQGVIGQAKLFAVRNKVSFSRALHENLTKKRVSALLMSLSRRG